MKNKIAAMKSIAVIEYSVEIVDWIKEEIRKCDTKTVNHSWDGAP